MFLIVFKFLISFKKHLNFLKIRLDFSEAGRLSFLRIRYLAVSTPLVEIFKICEISLLVKFIFINAHNLSSRFEYEGLMRFNSLKKSVCTLSKFTSNISKYLSPILFWFNFLKICIILFLDSLLLTSSLSCLRSLFNS